MQKFCEAVVAGKNGLEAYRAAHPGAAYNTAAGAAPKVLKRPEIQAEIARLRALQQQKEQIDDLVSALSQAPTEEEVLNLQQRVKALQVAPSAQVTPPNPPAKGGSQRVIAVAKPPPLPPPAEPGPSSSRASGCSPLSIAAGPGHLGLSRHLFMNTVRSHPRKLFPG